METKKNMSYMKRASYLLASLMFLALTSCMHSLAGPLDKSVENVLVDECIYKWPSENPSSYIFQGCIIQERERLQRGVHFLLRKKCSEKGILETEEESQCIVEELKALYKAENELERQNAISQKKLEQEQINKRASELSKKLLLTCDSYGFHRGTDKYAECMQKELHMWEVRRMEERKLNENYPLNCTITHTKFGKSFVSCN